MGGRGVENWRCELWRWKIVAELTYVQPGIRLSTGKRTSTASTRPRAIKTYKSQRRMRIIYTNRLLPCYMKAFVSYRNHEVGSKSLYKTREK